MPPQHRDTSRSAPIAVVSVHFADATAELRTQLVLSPEQIEVVASRISERHPDLECVIVSTCNRTELVLAGAADIEPARAIGVLHEALGFTPSGSAAPCLAATSLATVHSGASATEHLFRVACGLESQTLGDNEILGQLRRAWRAADAVGWAGPQLRSLFRDAFAVGKRARSSTDIGVGGAGVGTAVMAAIGERTGHAVIIGAGDAGRTVARRLAKRDHQVTIVNRTLPRAQQIATEVGGQAVALTGLDDVLVDAGVVVNAVGTCLLDRPRLQRLRDGVAGWSPLIIDLAATPSVDLVDGVDVIDLQQLQRHGDAAAERRLAAVSAVEALIADALERRHPLHPTHSPAGDRPAPQPQGAALCAY